MLKNILIYVIIIYRIGDNTMSNNVNNDTVFTSNQAVNGNTAINNVKTRYKYTCYDKNGKTDGDNFVDFGLYDLTNEAKRRFVNGYERTILLDFNVDGVIYDKSIFN